MTKNNVPGPFTRENAYNEIVDKVENIRGGGRC